MNKFYIKRSIILSLILFIFSFKITAANYYWVGGTGNWSDLNHWATTSGGTTLYTQIPTALDDVFFDANSFSATGQTVSINPLTAFCRNMTWSGVTNNPTLTGSNVTVLKIYGSLTFVTGMNMSFSGEVNFEATTPGKTITMAGKSFFDKVSFNGIGGEWTLQDAFATIGRITLNAGILTTNNQTVNAWEFYSSAPPFAPLRTLNMGSSVFNISGSVTCWAVSSSGLTFNSGTSIINCTNAAADFRGGDLTYYDLNFTNTTPGSWGSIGNSNIFHDVVFASKGYLYNSNTFHNATFYGDALIEGNNVYNDLTFTAGNTYSLWSHAIVTGSTQTINGIFHANGNCAAFINIHSSVAGGQAIINHPAGTVNTSFLILKDIKAAGGANFTANNSIDLGNNTGWTINAPSLQNLYWVGNGGNWSDGNHWSFTSGGTPSGCSPTPFTNIFFDANSFSATGQTVSINIPTAYCKDMLWTGVTNTPTLAGPSANLFKLYGSLKFVPGMNMTFAGPVDFEATTTGKTISMAGKFFKEKVNFNGVAGEWTLQDAFATIDRITLNAGILTTNNQTVNAWEFYSSAPPFAPLRTLNMGSSVFNISGSVTCWAVSSSGLTLNCGTSVINCTNAAADFRGGDLTYHDLNFTNTTPGSSGTIGNTNIFHDVVFASKGYLYNSNTFHNATFYGDALIEGNNVYNDLTFTAGNTYSLWSHATVTGSTQTINGTFYANGNCGAFINIHSSVSGGQAIISHPAGTVNTSFLILKDIKAAGGANFTANNSIDLGNNTGWTINAVNPKNLFWIGNGGNWNDGNHWSLTSGGSASGCAPTPLDNVFFDVNSFSAPAQTVSINIPAAYCKDILWTGVTNTPTLAGPSINILNFYGSLKFIPAMNMTFAGPVNFEATTSGKTISMAGKSFKEKVNFNGIGGGWALQDAFTTIGRITLNAGILTTSNQTVNAWEFYSSAPPFAPVRTLNMGSSVFNISGSIACWAVSSNGMTLNCGTSVINCTNAAADFRGGDLTYYDLNFTNTSAAASLYLIDRNSFHNVVFASTGYITHSNSFNKAIFLGDGTIESNNIFNDLDFTANHTYTIWKNTTQTVNDHWRIQGSCTSYILLQTDNAGFFATVTKASGSVLGYNIHIKDIHCTGGANFIAYNSVDLGGNTGWNFSTLPPLSNPGLITGPSPVCSGATGVMYYISPVQGAISYLWTVPPGATITNGQGDTLIVVNFGTASSGNIAVQSFNGCNPGTSSSTFAVVLESSALTPTVVLATNPGGTICKGILVVFMATASNTGSGTVSYNFKVNGISIQNSSSNSYSSTTLSNGDDITCNISVNGGVCNVSSSAVSNNIRINIIDCLCKLDIKTRIYPNPAGDVLTIDKNPTVCKVTMNLYNTLGQLVMKDKIINDGINQIKLSTLSLGAYYYKFISNNSILLTGKITKLNF